MRKNIFLKNWGLHLSYNILISVHQTNKSVSRLLFLFLFSCFFINSKAQVQPVKLSENNVSQNKIRVACIGNSITYGGGLKDKANESYPAVLQKMLGEKYEVRNFGRNGATLLTKGNNPYINTDEFQKAIVFNPDIVIIDLGINDTGPKVWPNFKDDFTSDYINLIQKFRALDAKPDIWICSMTPYFNQSKRFRTELRDWYWEVQENIQIIAKSAKTGLIDLHTPLYTKPHLFSDAVHPDKEGAQIIAKTIYGVLSGDYGGLSIAEVFGSHMVLQRNKSIPIWGKANQDQEVTVSFARQTLRTKADMNGNWKVTFPARKEGGPFEIRISSHKKEFIFKDVLIGEVWICSGQSNMAFRLSESATASQDIPLAMDSNIRFFSMKTVDKSIKDVWEPAVLERINNLEYEGGVWERCTPQSAKDFSAVAYYFGKKLRTELHVPVGLIHNAKGGSPAEAWIDRNTLEFDPLLADIFQDWKKNPMIALWCRERAIYNTGNAKNPLQRHPYEPSYLFETCMKPWIGFPIKGAIWYQGEANVHNVGLHTALFTALIKSWRKYWGADFPVFFAQLSSFQNPAWPAFRNSQRILMEQIPGTGMAVTSDVGDSTDIHPKRKKEVGERLALWALAKEYGYKEEYSGPLFRDATIQKENVIIRFSHNGNLKTSDGKSIRSFELAGYDKVFKPAVAHKNGSRILVHSDEVADPHYVRYGWQPFSEGNLTNGENLPASTFATELRPK